MNLKDCPVPIYGDVSWRGKCPPEHVEQASFFSKLRRDQPDTFGLIALHPRNEGLKSAGQFSSVVKHQIEGMAKGAADIVIPGLSGCRRYGAFVCELKRQDHTLSKWEQGQQEYLAACAAVGAFACVALGAAAAWGAFMEWANPLDELRGYGLP